MTLNGRFLKMMNKAASKVWCHVLLLVLFAVAPAYSAEITAIDFNGDLIGKVIPDGKVVSFDNQLVGNVTADSLIVNFDGELIGGVIPQGIAIGNDNKLLGKVSNDGSVRLASGKVVGKVLPNGLVVNDYFEVLGAVLFPGLIYSDDGKTIGRLTGDGMYTNLQGQQIGFISPDGYAYRKIGNEYVLDGRLISSKMVVSMGGEFIGSVSPGGNVTDFEARTIGFVKANEYIYNENNRVVGRIVKSGFAFDNAGKYLGFVTYNGEVVNKEDLIGRWRADGRVVDAKGDVIGFAIDISSAATDLNGKYLGRIMPGGGIAKAREIVGTIGPRGVVLGKDGKIAGQIVHSGPVFDYKAALRAHALKNGSVISLEGAPIGNMRANTAYDNNGVALGATLDDGMAVAFDGMVLGMSGIDASVSDGADKKFVSPFGFVFSSDGVLSGAAVSPDPIYNLSGALIAYIMPDGAMYDKGVVTLGRLTETGFSIDERNRLLGKNIPVTYTFSDTGSLLGIIAEDNLVLNKDLKPEAKILPDNSVVRAEGNTGVEFNPLIGTASDKQLVIGTGGDLLGYAGIDGAVRDGQGNIAGRVVDDGVFVDNAGLAVGRTIGYNTVVNDACEVLGVITPRGDIRNYRDIVMGKILTDGRAISETGAAVGHQVIPGSVVDYNGNIIGMTLTSGKVSNYAGELLGCIDKRGKLRNADGEVMAGKIEFYRVMNPNGIIIGRTILDGSVVNDADQFIGYMQPDGNVNSKTGVPVGQLFKYKFAFDDNNNYMGRVTSDARVINARNEEAGKVDFSGTVIDSDGKNTGYALYDMYIYDGSNNVFGYIARDGNVLSLNGKNLGMIDKGFLVGNDNKIIGRGNRDYYIRTENNAVLGELEMSGNLVDNAGHVAGSLKENGRIIDSTGNVLAVAKPLQYYSLLKELTETEAKEKPDMEGRPDWYKDAQSGNSENITDIGSIPQAGGADQEEMQKYRKSLGIALTPDGEYLGEIMEDGSVVDKSGKTVGKRMPDGLIIDDDGALIGIEEVKKPDNSGMFIPAGTFGPGGAYGIGNGPGGNLGPGGGFGTGERYDPQRSAALSAAQNQRREAMAVGKISSEVRREAFEGYQKNWDEQGIAKAVSSWRVNMSEMIFADKPIPAVIARSIDSNNPTPVTAYVERNVYAEEGRNIVIPAGSRMMGTLGGLTAGTETTSQSAKVQITWERLIRPDGVLFVFQGITGDAQGRGGALGYLDQQLFKKYTLPIMTTALTSYTSYIMAPKDSTNSSEETPRQQAANDARQNFLQDMNRVFEQILADKSNIKPLTYVPAGTRIIVYPNVDLWLRTPERDEAELARNLSKRDVLMDDNKLEQDRVDVKNKRKTGMTDADRAATSGSVLYEADGSDAEAVAVPRLMDDSKNRNKKPTASGSPGLVPAPTGGSTPPPPPSFSNSGSSGASSSSSSSSSKTDNSVPQLF